MRSVGCLPLTAMTGQALPGEKRDSGLGESPRNSLCLDRTGKNPMGRSAAADEGGLVAVAAQSRD